MKKHLLFLAVVFLFAPFFSHATRVEIPGLYVSTQIDHMSPSGVVVVRITCAIVSTGTCYTMEGIPPVMPPVVLPSALPTFSNLLQNSTITLFEPTNGLPIYTGKLNSIQVNPTVINGLDANQVNLFFQPAIEN